VIGIGGNQKGDLMTDLHSKKIKQGKNFTRFGTISQLNLDAMYNFLQAE
jgi:hypothetical protein